MLRTNPIGRLSGQEMRAGANYPLIFYNWMYAPIKQRNADAPGRPLMKAGIVIGTVAEASLVLAGMGVLVTSPSDLEGNDWPQWQDGPGHNGVQAG